MSLPGSGNVARNDGFYRRFKQACDEGLTDLKKAPNAMLLAGALLARPEKGEMGLPDSWNKFAEANKDLADNMRCAVAAMVTKDGTPLLSRTPAGCPAPGNFRLQVERHAIKENKAEYSKAGTKSVAKPGNTLKLAVSAAGHPGTQSDKPAKTVTAADEGTKKRASRAMITKALGKTTPSQGTGASEQGHDKQQAADGDFVNFDTVLKNAFKRGMCGETPVTGVQAQS